jgi:hypothetical protein
VQQVPAAHLVEQKLLGRTTDAALLPLPELPAARHGPPLDGRRTAVKHEQRADVQEEQLAQPAEQAQLWSVLQHLARRAVAHRLDELNQPNGRVDREPLAVERVDGTPPAADRKQIPQALDSHAAAPAPPRLDTAEPPPCCCC